MLPFHGVFVTFSLPVVRWKVGVSWDYPAAFGAGRGSFWRRNRIHATVL